MNPERFDFDVITGPVPPRPAPKPPSDAPRPSAAVANPTVSRHNVSQGDQ
jgi:hypothetical protein